jgi:hypothetical protein
MEAHPYGVASRFVPSHNCLVHESQRVVALGVTQIALVFKDA